MDVVSGSKMSSATNESATTSSNTSRVYFPPLAEPVARC
jgi:hypothetical protein